MKVGELRELLKDLPDYLTVNVAYNNGCSYDTAKSVEVELNCIFVSTEEPACEAPGCSRTAQYEVARRKVCEDHVITSPDPDGCGAIPLRRS